MEDDLRQAAIILDRVFNAAALPICSEPNIQAIPESANLGVSELGALRFIYREKAQDDPKADISASDSIRIREAFAKIGIDTLVPEGRLTDDIHDVDTLFRIVPVVLVKPAENPRPAGHPGETYLMFPKTADLARKQAQLISALRGPVN